MKNGKFLLLLSGVRDHIFFTFHNIFGWYHIPTWYNFIISGSWIKSEAFCENIVVFGENWQYSSRKPHFFHKNVSVTTRNSHNVNLRSNPKFFERIIRYKFYLIIHTSILLIIRLLSSFKKFWLTRFRVTTFSSHQK
jgi:hypothetical protein